jgi:carbonic anhydrase/acetyltransferase-like protein (isoleucine patch superfamily)
MIFPFQGKEPQIHDSCFLAPSADIIGDVEIGENSSVWFQVVIRGDVNSIKIGERTNVQDHSTLHVTRPNQFEGASKTGNGLVIGDDVTIGHRVTLHGCTIKNRVLVGMGAIIMDKAVIDDDSIVAAGALVTQGKVFPPRSLIQGSPATAVRPLTDKEVAFMTASSANYVKDNAIYDLEFEALFANDEGCGHDHGDHDHDHDHKDGDDCCGGGCHS